MIYFGFDALETMESDLFWFSVAVIPTEEPSEVTNRSGKSSLLARKMLLVHIPHGSFSECRRGRAWEVLSMIKTSLCKTDFLLWSALSKSSLTSNGEETPNTIFTWTVSVPDWIRKGFPTGKLLPSPSRLSSQLHHFLRHVFMLS